jgi:hypothetical protein
MATYCFKCPEHGHDVEVNFPWSELGNRTPKCPDCDLPMLRDYGAEHFRGVTHRSKGIFPYVDTNLGDAPVEVDSYQHLKRELDSRGLGVHTPTSEESYRIRHKRDFGGKR